MADAHQATPTSKAVPITRPWWRRMRLAAHLDRLLMLAALTGLAVTGPVLDVIGRAPEFLMFWHADQLDVAVLLLFFTVLPPLLLWAAELVAAILSDRLAGAAHAAFVAFLAGLLAMQVGKRALSLGGAAAVAFAAAVTLLWGLLFVKASWPRTWLRYMAPAPLLFVLLFATTSPSAGLLRGGDPDGRQPAAAGAGMPPVVMVLFDEFPLKSLLDSSGRIDRRVYPNFARLAEQSTWYRNATGVAGYTPSAMPAMLTGRYPAGPRAPAWFEYPDNLFTLLDGAYEIEALETVAKLCPPEECPDVATQDGLRPLLRDSVEVLRDLVSPDRKGLDTTAFASLAAGQPGARRDTEFRFDRLSRNQPARWSQFMELLRPPARPPTLYFLHLLLPHGPWRYLPDGTLYNHQELSSGYEHWQDLPEPVMTLNQQRHLLQTAYVDRLVGELIDRFQATGLWDRALVVLAADHGEGLVAGEPVRDLSDGNAAWLGWVPTFVKAPGQRQGRVDDRNFEQVDLLPTVAGILGVDVPWEMDGVDQSGPPARKGDAKHWFAQPPPRHRLFSAREHFPEVLEGVTGSLVDGSLGTAGLFHFGDFADLVGRPPSAVGEVGGEPVGAKLADWERYDRVEPGGNRVPAMVHGLLERAPPPGSSLLVTVNGRIAAEVEPFASRDGGRVDSFAAVVPAGSFTAGDGHRQLQVFLVDRSAGTPRLRPVALSAWE